MARSVLTIAQDVRQCDEEKGMGLSSKVASISSVPQLKVTVDMSASHLDAVLPRWSAEGCKQCVQISNRFDKAAGGVTENLLPRHGVFALSTWGQEGI